MIAAALQATSRPVLLAAATSAERRLARRAAPGCRILQVGPAARDLTGLDGRAAGLVSFGFAAGLDPALAPGTLLLPRTVVHGPAQPFSVHAGWHAAVHAALGGIACAMGALLAVDAVVGSRHAKRALRVRSGAAAVDLESGRLGAAAARLEIPYLVLRVVLDGADDDLPPRSGALVDRRGATRPLAVGCALLGSPRAFLRLLARYRQATPALERALVKVAPALRSAPADATPGCAGGSAHRRAE